MGGKVRIGARGVCNRVGVGGGGGEIVRGKKDSERDKNRKVDGGEEEIKNEKKRGWQKSDFCFHNGPRANRPMTPTKKALRVAL